MQQARRQREYEAITQFKRKRQSDQQEYRMQRQRRNTITSNHGRRERQSILRDAAGPAVLPSTFNSAFSDMGSVKSPRSPAHANSKALAENPSNLSINDQNTVGATHHNNESHDDTALPSQNRAKREAFEENKLIFAQESKPLTVPGGGSEVPIDTDSKPIDLTGITKKEVNHVQFEMKKMVAYQDSKKTPKYII